MGKALLPEIGFGTWKILPNFRAQKAVSEALEAGYRLIDTARIYGNEKGVGKAIAASTVTREEIFVTTKLWNSDQGYDAALKAFDKSLERLGLEYVDLYLIHWPVTGKRLDSWRALEEIQKSGRAKHIGVSNFTLKHLKELADHSSVRPAVNQIELHPFLYGDQVELLDYCKGLDIAVEAYSPLAHGHRIDDPVLTEIAASHQKTPAQVMLRWAIEHGTTPIPKSTNSERIVENLHVLDFELSAKEVKKIDGLSDGLRTCWDPNEMQ